MWTECWNSREESSSVRTKLGINWASDTFVIQWMIYHTSLYNHVKMSSTSACERDQCYISHTVLNWYFELVSKDIDISYYHGPQSPLMEKTFYFVVLLLSQIFGRRGILEDYRSFTLVWTVSVRVKRMGGRPWSLEVHMMIYGWIQGRIILPGERKMFNIFINMFLWIKICLFIIVYRKKYSRC